MCGAGPGEGVNGALGACDRGVFKEELAAGPGEGHGAGEEGGWGCGACGAVEGVEDDLVADFAGQGEEGRGLELGLRLGHLGGLEIGSFDICGVVVILHAWAGHVLSPLVVRVRV